MTNNQEDDLIRALEQIADSNARIVTTLQAIEVILFAGLLIAGIVLWPALTR